MKFAGLIDVKGKLIGYSAGIFFAIIGILTGVTLVFIFGFIVFLLLLWGDIPFLNFYVVDSKGILCVRGFPPKRVMFEKIVDVRKIKWEELKNMIEASWVKQTLARYQNRNYTLSHPEEIVPTIKESYSYNRLLSYCTAAPSTIVYPNKKAKVLVRKSDFILLTLSDGKQYVVSPKDVDGFLEEVKKYRKSDVFG